MLENARLELSGIISRSFFMKIFVLDYHSLNWKENRFDIIENSCYNKYRN
nr:MAG TPA: hypothetical protein [Caudoviricetes sp.]